MSTIETEVYILPSYWASALINGDYSGMTDEEEAEINKWIDKTKPGYCVSCSEEPYFTHGHDANRNQGSEVLEYTFHVVHL